MVIEEILAYHSARWRRPWAWYLVCGWCFLRTLGFVLRPETRPQTTWQWTCVLLGAALSMAVLVWVSPWPWLWTRRPGLPSSWRHGLLQAPAAGYLAMLPVYGFYSGFRQGLRPVLLNPDLLGSLPLFCLAGFLTVALEQAGLRRAEAERREQEARWILLRGQLSPHVLFNGMNNLARLIRKDPERAERTAEDMAVLFRQLMDHAHRHLSPLKEEREMVERYLAMEALRLGDRLHLEWDWDPALDAMDAPPFVLQPLVENALKHGVAPCPEGGRLRIRGQIEGKTIRLSVENTGMPFQGRRREGLGLKNLDSRLDLAFQEHGKLDLRDESGLTIACVSFPRLEELP